MKGRKFFILVLLVLGYLIVPLLFFTSGYFSIESVKPSTPQSILFSSNSSDPTVLNVDVYYEIQNLGGPHTFFTEFTLERGEVYLICSSWFSNLILYNFSDFNDEIEATVNGGKLCFAPAITKTYYLKWEDIIQDRQIGIFKADKCSSEDIIDGIQTVYKDDDWGYALIHFISPDTTYFSNPMEMRITSEGTLRPWVIITEGSGQSKNENEMQGSGISREVLHLHPNEGFLLILNYEGIFQITLPLDLSFLPIVIILLIISLVAVISLILGIRTYKKKHRKSTIKIRKKKETITREKEYSKAGERIDKVVEGWKKRSKEDKNIREDPYFKSIIRERDKLREEIEKLREEKNNS